MLHHMVIAGVTGIVCGALLAAGAAGAACTTTSDAGAVRKSVRQANRCDYRALRAGVDPSCPVAPAPACAGSLVSDANNLAFGPTTLAEVDRRALRDQLRCQGRISRAVSHYVGTKLRLLIRGTSNAAAEIKAVKQIDKLAELCAVDVAQDAATQIVLPSVGPQCAAAIGTPGTPVKTNGLRTCLRQLLDVWVNRWGPNPQPLRPNILFILTDDQRWDTTDATHSLDGVTPVMPGVRGELGGSGVEFSNAFMGTPLCCPSRSSILRGQYANITRVYTNTGANGGADDFQPLESETVGTLLQAAGYRTGFYGKYLNGYNLEWNATMHIPAGWTVWNAFRNVRYFDYDLIENGAAVHYGTAPGDYSTDVLREKAKQFITDSVNAGKPFFLHLSFKAPHGPWQPAPRHVGRFAGLPPWRPTDSYNEPDVSDKPTWVKNTPQLTPTEQAALDAIRIAQLEMLQAVDEAIGGSTTYGITGIMQHLRNLGIDDDTMVVFFADNGWHWGEHRYQAKNKPYEESIRSPMFVRYSKLAPLPRTETQFALNIDFCPTFVDLALRATDPQPTITFSGTSLVRLLDGTAPTWRTDFITEGWPLSHVWASVRDAQWKYTELPLTPGDPATEFERELYDLVNDPLELNNVETDEANALRILAMRDRLREIRTLWPADSHPTFEDEGEE